MFDSTQTALTQTPLSERETVLLPPAPLATLGRTGPGSTVVLCSPLGASGSASGDEWELVESQESLLTEQAEQASLWTWAEQNLELLAGGFLLGAAGGAAFSAVAFVLSRAL